MAEKSFIKKAYDTIMNPDPKDKANIGGAKDALKDRGKSIDRAVDEALGKTGTRTDLDDTGAKW